MNYPINEIFCSLQGEGYNQGVKCVFIRFSGCNCKCFWCDTEHSTNRHLSVSQILDEITRYNCKNVIITGGEPSIHNLLPLLKELKCSGFWIAIETNGSISLNEYMNYLDYVSLSPKFEINQTNADELRIVNDGKSCKELLDFENIIAARYYYLSPLYLNNSFNYLETLNLLGTINRVSQNHWHLSIQMHKLADIP